MDGSVQANIRFQSGSGMKIGVALTEIAIAHAWKFWILPDGITNGFTRISHEQVAWNCSHREF